MPTGKIYGLLGKNGAGKTTTICSIMGLIKLSSGRIKLFGKDITENRMNNAKLAGAIVETPGFYSNILFALKYVLSPFCTNNACFGTCFKISRKIRKSTEEPRALSSTRNIKKPFIIPSMPAMIGNNTEIMTYGATVITI